MLSKRERAGCKFQKNKTAILYSNHMISFADLTSMNKGTQKMVREHREQTNSRDNLACIALIDSFTHVL
jgi:uncharacterized DUF497 family protein